MARSTSPPEAALIQHARHAQDISVADAAAQAHITELEWARVEAGQGERAPADTLARMAHALGIRSATLGPIREDAGAELHALELQDVPAREPRPEPEDASTALGQARALLQDLRQRKAELDTLIADFDARKADFDARMLKLDAFTAELDARKADLEAQIAELKAQPKAEPEAEPTVEEASRPVRYVKAIIGAALAAIIFGGTAGLATYYALSRMVEVSLPPGATVLRWGLPGPFGQWGNVWLWSSLAYFIVGLPRTLLKAHRGSKS